MVGCAMRLIKVDRFTEPPAEDLIADCIIALSNECGRLEAKNIALESMLRTEVADNAHRKETFGMVFWHWIMTWAGILGYMGFMVMRQWGWISW